MLSGPRILVDFNKITAAAGETTVAEGTTIDHLGEAPRENEVGIVISVTAQFHANEEGTVQTTVRISMWTHNAHAT